MDPKTPHLAVHYVVTGDDPPATDVRKAASVEPPAGVELLARDLPRSGALAPPPVLAESVAEARKHYTRGAFAECLRALGDPTVATEILGQGHPELAARVLFWRVACLTGGRATDLARTEAGAFGVLGLPVPPDADAAAPDVESLIGREIAEVRRRGRATVHVHADATTAEVVVDGRGPAHAVPCAIDLPPGDHVFRLEGDGLSPEVHTARVELPTTDLTYATHAATPETSAARWAVRYGSGSNIDSTPSLRLLSQALRTRRLVLVQAEGGHSPRLRATLTIDGFVAARAERSTELRRVDEDSRRLFRDVLVRGRLVEPAPTLLERPIFWISLGVVAAGAAVTTYFVAQPPERRTEVRF